MMEFVSWDYDISNIWKHDPNVPNHQSVLHISWLQLVCKFTPIHGVLKCFDVLCNSEQIGIYDIF